MRYAVQWVRSVFFIGQMYVAMLVLAVAFAPLALLRRDMALRACHSFCRYVRWSAAWIAGLHSEIRGPVPDGAVLIAAKHQSFFDIILIFGALPRPRFVMKKQLKWAPLLGWYAMRIGCVPVDRGKRGSAIKDMMKRVAQGQEEAGQLIIYPQGTRVAPGAKKPYKVGTAVLYDQMGGACVPVATNVGMFWPKHSLFRKPGLAVVEFLPPIPAGLPPREFLGRMESVIELHSDRLMTEAQSKG
ncbi:lysophospholipid acyltransferase family protein [Roseinatronobacter alkalisoli]|uniref:Lysophospholipid acyltransferase family protein n=1 Tax=Roseinatronobacter alkalisoli TaxID=3028235 RepID=A0ABT5T8S0_9RHOB|nr:lysophospholipid acyltransferase family protein [Roseinatronobacter sp. HJB301]MDD7971520.1 lysophospholipid acyltransferase family protein [Roseinatronobacter sp. HJB301]